MERVADLRSDLTRALLPVDLLDNDGVRLRSDAGMMSPQSGILLVPLSWLNGVRTVRIHLLDSALDVERVLLAKEGGVALLVDPAIPAGGITVRAGPLLEGEALFALDPQAHELRGIGLLRFAAGNNSASLAGRRQGSIHDRWIFDEDGLCIGLWRGDEPETDACWIRLDAALAPSGREPVAIDGVSAYFFDPDPRARIDRGALYLAADEPLCALRQFLAALERDPAAETSLRDSLCLAVALECSKVLRGGAVAQDWEPMLIRCCDLQDPRPPYWLSMWFLFNGRFEEAVDRLNVGLESDPLDFNLRGALRAAIAGCAEERRERGELLSAIVLLEKGVVQFADDFGLMFDLAGLYYDLGTKDQALHWLKRCGATADPARSEHLQALIDRVEEGLDAVLVYDDEQGELPFTVTAGPTELTAVIFEREDEGEPLLWLTPQAAGRLQLQPADREPTEPWSVTVPRLEMLGHTQSDVTASVGPLPFADVDLALSMDLIELFGELRRQGSRWWLNLRWPDFGD